MKAKKVKTMGNPYDVLRQLAGATHLEIQYFLPQVTGWLEDKDDPLMADMDSITIALLVSALDSLNIVPLSKSYTQ